MKKSGIKCKNESCAWEKGGRCTAKDVVLVPQYTMGHYLMCFQYEPKSKEETR
jgi:hypothetical protein